MDGSDLAVTISRNEPAIGATLLSELINDLGIEDDTTVVVSRVYE